MADFWGPSALHSENDLQNSEQTLCTDAENPGVIVQLVDNPDHSNPNILATFQIDHVESQNLESNPAVISNSETPLIEATLSQNMESSPVESSQDPVAPNSLTPLNPVAPEDAPQIEGLNDFMGNDQTISEEFLRFM